VRVFRRPPKWIFRPVLARWWRSLPASCHKPDGARYAHRSWLERTPCDPVGMMRIITELEAFRKGLKAEAGAKGRENDPMGLPAESLRGSLEGQPEIQCLLGCNGENTMSTSSMCISGSPWTLRPTGGAGWCVTSIKNACGNWRKKPPSSGGPKAKDPNSNLRKCRAADSPNFQLGNIGRAGLHTDCEHAGGGPFSG